MNEAVTLPIIFVFCLHNQYTVDIDSSSEFWGLDALGEHGDLLVSLTEYNFDIPLCIVWSIKECWVQIFNTHFQNFNINSIKTNGMDQFLGWAIMKDEKKCTEGYPENLGDQEDIQ